MAGHLLSRRLLPTRTAVSRWRLVQSLTLGLCLFLAEGEGTSETPVNLGVFIQYLPEETGEYRAVQQHRPEVIELGVTFDMDCHMKPGGNRDAVITWYKDGQLFSPTPTALLSGWLTDLYQDYQIRFLNFSVQDAGIYMCETPQGNVQANLTVRPVIVNFTRLVKVFEGQPAVLRCDAKGFPTPTITWSDPSDVSIPTAVSNIFRIKEASHVLNGTYKCAAHNLVGEAIAKTELLVMERLTFLGTMHQAVIHPSARKTVELQCRAKGRPTPQYKWFEQREGSQRQEMTGQTAANLVMHNVREDVNYTCEVHSYLPCCSDQDAQEPLVHTYQVIGDDGNNRRGSNTRNCVAGKSCESGAGSVGFLPSLLLFVTLLPLAVHA